MKRLSTAMLISLTMLSCDETKTTQPSQQPPNSEASLFLRPEASAAEGMPSVDSVRIRLAKLSSDSLLLDTTLPSASLDTFLVPLPRSLAFHLLLDGIKVRPNGTSTLLWTGELNDTAANDTTPSLAKIRIRLHPQDLLAPTILAQSLDTTLDPSDSTCTLSWLVSDDSLFSVTGSGEIVQDSAGHHTERFRIPPGAITLAVIVATDRAGNSASDTVRIHRPLPSPNPRTSTPTFTLHGGNEASSLALEIQDATPEATIHFRTDSIVPTCQDSLYVIPLKLEASTLVKAIACAPGHEPSPVDSIQVLMKVAAPQVSAPAGLYTLPQTLSLSTATPQATLHYTIDGSDPTCDRGRYKAPIPLDSNITIKAIACRDGWSPSRIETAAYGFKVPDLQFSPDSGIHGNSITVSITSPLPGTTILFTTDSTEPTRSITGSTLLYSAPFPLYRSKTLRAQAFRKGWEPSSIATRSYVLYGDTIPLADFESGQANTLWGAPFWPFGCGSGTNAAGTAGCNITKHNSKLLAPSRMGDPPSLGNQIARVDFDLHPARIANGADSHDGPGFAGLYASVPPAAMAQVHTLVFWARFEPGPGNTASQAPLLVELAHSNLDNMNAGFSDGFERLIVPLDTAWRQYMLSFTGFWAPRQAIVRIADSTNFTPRTPSWILPSSNGFGSTSAMNDLGLSAWWGAVHHSYSDITWLHGVNRDLGYSKASITKFRWSVLQPSSQPVAQETDPFAGLSGSFRGSLLIDRIQLLRPRI